MIFSHSYKRIPNILDLLATFTYLSILAACNNEKKPDKIRDVAVGGTNSLLGKATSFKAGEQSFFKKQGINSSFKNYDSGKQSIRELLTEKVDFTKIVN